MVKIFKKAWYHRVKGPYRILALALIYTFLLIASFWLAYQFRFDFMVPSKYSRQLLKTMTWVIPIKILLLVLFRQSPFAPLQ